MAVYSKDGTPILSVYGKDGNRLGMAYDVDGNPLITGNSLRIMEYNVGGWYIGSGTNVPAAQDAAFYALQNEIISSQDADILCICEYWSTFSKTGRTARSLLSQYYPYIYEQSGTSQYFGRCVCSKYPITDYVVNYFTKEPQRYYDVATINVNGTVVRVLVTHLSANNIPNRIAQAKEMYDYIAAHEWETFLVFGDFNSPLHDPFSEQNTGVYQQFLDDGCSIANGGAFGILPTACNSANWETDKFAIDNIIASPDISITNVWTDLTKITNDAVLAANKMDHVPLLAEIEFKEATP